MNKKFGMWAQGAVETKVVNDIHFGYMIDDCSFILLQSWLGADGLWQTSQFVIQDYDEMQAVKQTIESAYNDFTNI